MSQTEVAPGKIIAFKVPLCIYFRKNILTFYTYISIVSTLITHLSNSIIIDSYNYFN